MSRTVVIQPTTQDIARLFERVTYLEELIKKNSKVAKSDPRRTRVRENTPLMASIIKALGKRETTLFTLAEAEDLEFAQFTEPEDIALVADFQANCIPEIDFPVKSFDVLIKNWDKEFHKASGWKSRQPKSAVETKDPAPPGWRAFYDDLLHSQGWENVPKNPNPTWDALQPWQKIDIKTQLNIK